MDASLLSGCSDRGGLVGRRGTLFPGRGDSTLDHRLAPRSHPALGRHPFRSHGARQPIPLDVSRSDFPRATIAGRAAPGTRTTAQLDRRGRGARVPEPRRSHA
ncbi:hypothetical protein IH922_02205 [candidate division KSB1 bacterium]|nr:hypothetical protein [candidate division KSB1 bacterium]